jgi:hypothetical protein
VRPDTEAQTNLLEIIIFGLQRAESDVLRIVRVQPCEEHPGMPCAQCNPCGGIDEPPDISRSVMRVMIDAKNGPRH